MKFVYSLVLLFYLPVTLFSIEWKDVEQREVIDLYAGNLPLDLPYYSKQIGLSLHLSDQFHVKHDITHPMPLPDNCVDSYQAEDVLEHIEFERLEWVINEIYRVLKPGGYFRLSVPDYRFDVYYERSLKDKNGKIIFDAGGGGKFVNGKVVDGGHVWFPTFELVCNLLQKTKFYDCGTIVFLHYYDECGKSITYPINYERGYIKRTPDHDSRAKNPYRAMSIVVDLYK